MAHGPESMQEVTSEEGFDPLYGIGVRRRILADDGHDSGSGRIGRELAALGAGPIES